MLQISTQIAESKNTNLKVVEMQHIGIGDKADPDFRFTVLWITENNINNLLLINYSNANNFSDNVSTSNLRSSSGLTSGF